MNHLDIFQVRKAELKFMGTTLTLKFPLPIIQRSVIYSLVDFKTQNGHHLEDHLDVI